MKVDENQPLGIRLNNPGNIEWGSDWQGLVPRSESWYRDSKVGQRARFAQFKTPAWGIRALARTLITYQDFHGIKTIRQAINRWAPPVENNSNAYVSAVAYTVGVSADAKIDFHDYTVMRPMVEAIIRHENGAGPLKTKNSWYSDAVIDKAMELAGIVKPVKNALATTQGAATGTAVVAGSAALIAEIVQNVTPIVSQIQVVSSATEGFPGWLRIAVVVLTVVAVGAAAWALLSKQREVKAV